MILRCTRALFLIVLFSGIFTLALMAHPKLKWKHYFNDRWSFCVDYPAQWKKQEGFNKAGIFTYPWPQPLNRELSGIEIGGRVNQPSQVDERRQQTLDEIFTGKPAVLEAYGKFEHIEIIEKRNEQFQGSAAVYARIQYGQAGEQWISEDLTVLTDEEMVFHLQMRCRVNEFSTFDSIFQIITAEKFRIECQEKTR